MNRPARSDVAPDDPSTIEEYDYEALEAAVMQTRRGRWFLREYLRRHQNDETRRMLKALQRLAEASAQFVPAGPRPETPAAATLEALRLLLADTANRLARLMENASIEPTPPEMAAARLSLLLEDMPADRALKALSTLRHTFTRMAEVLEEPFPQATPVSEAALHDDTEEAEEAEETPATETAPAPEDEPKTAPAPEASADPAENTTGTPASAPATRQRKARIVIHRHSDSRKVSIPLPNEEKTADTPHEAERKTPRRRAVVRLHKKKAG